MDSPVQRTAAEWFAEAQRSYIEDHQGCPWCGGSHRVHHVHSSTKTIFACQHCDFQAFRDTQSARCGFIPGEARSEVSDTMLGYPIYQT